MFNTSLTSTFSRQGIHKVYPRVNYYINTLNNVRNLNTNRYYETGGYEHLGMTFLEKIINDSGIYEELKECSNMSNYDYYVNKLSSRLSHLEHSIDPAQTNIIRKNNYFVKASSPIYKEEYILPVTSNRLVKDYLFDDTWTTWSTIKSFRMLNASTNSFTFLINTDRLFYTKDCPDVSVFTIDIILFLLQYRTYLKTNRLNADTVNIVEYLHKYVIFPCLKNDPLDVWLLNLYNKIAINDIYYDNKLIDVTDEYASQTRLGSGFKDFHLDIINIFALLKGGNIYPEVAFNSLLTSNNIRYNVSYIEKQKNVTFPQLSQYNHLEFLAYNRWFRLMAQLIMMSPLTKHNSYKTNLLRDLNTLKLKRFWNNRGISVYVKTYIQDEFDQLYSDITDM